MSTYAPGPPPPQQPQQPQKKKTSKWLIAILVVVGLFGLVVFGSCVAGLASLSSSSPSVTPVDDSSIEASTGGEPAPSTTKPAAPTRSKANIDKSDIKLHVKMLSKKCYGYGIGCNISYRVIVDGAHMSDWPKEGDVEVSYRVTGLEDGSEDDSFMIALDDGSYEKPYEEYSSTRSRGTKLSVKVVDVEYSE